MHRLVLATCIASSADEEGRGTVKRGDNTRTTCALDPL